MQSENAFGSLLRIRALQTASGWRWCFTSQLPYSIEVVTDAEEAARCIAERGTELDLIFDAFGIEHAHSGYFVLADSVREDGPGHHLEKPFTRRKPTDCLYAAELHMWAERLDGRAATAA